MVFFLVKLVKKLCQVDVLVVEVDIFGNEMLFSNFFKCLLLVECFSVGQLSVLEKWVSELGMLLIYFDN